MDNKVTREWWPSKPNFGLLDVYDEYVKQCKARDTEACAFDEWLNGVWLPSEAQHNG